MLRVPLRLRAPRWLGWITLTIATAFGVFVLPYAFPPAVPTFSSTYTLGFSNRVASLATVVLSLCVLATRTVLTPRTERDGEAINGAPVPPWAVTLGCAVAAAYSLWLGWTWLRSGIVFDDGTYILNQLLRGLRDHAVLYRDVEWPYGPLLYYWPLETQRLLAHLGVSAWATYVLMLALMQGLGVIVLGYVLNRLPLSRAMRSAVLLLFTLGTLLPILGINYTLLRFLLPHLLLLLILRLRRPVVQAVLFAAAGALCMSVSPELGVALTAGVGGSALYQAWHQRRGIWVAMIFAPVAGVAAFSASMSRDYFAVMKSFATGGFNLIAQPRFHVLALLLAAIVLAPVAVASAVRGRRPEAAALCGLYLCSLAMLGSAFGRVDHLHTFYSGLGVYLLASITADRALLQRAPRQRRLAGAAWVAALALVAAMGVVEKTDMNGRLLAAIFAGPADDGIDLPRLQAILGGAKVSAPISLPWRVHEALWASHQLVPSYSFEMRGAWDDASVQRKLDELRAAPFALIPQGRYVWEYALPSDRRLERYSRLGVTYRRRRDAYRPGAFIARELGEHWEPVSSFGWYTLFRRVQ